VRINGAKTQIHSCSFPAISHQDDQDSNEDANEIDVELERVSEIVFVAVVDLLDDDLSVIQHEATKEEQAAVQTYKEDYFRLEEQIEQTQPEQIRQAGHQEPAQI